MKIKSAEYTVTGVRFDQYPTDNLKEFVFLGRSNVGKSSFINSLLNKKNLAYTSSKPGKTQALNFFLINQNFYFVDVPGYGYAKVSKKQREEFGRMIEAYLVNRKELSRAFLIVDLRHKPSEDDILMYNFLKYYDIPVTVIATKADKIGSTHIRKHIKTVENTLNIYKEDNLIIYSSTSLKGKEEVLNMLSKMTL
ncbi:ribosome biogenesis GTP-binding protein YihA/YsxC [Mycoplasmatota bacterium WC44]